MTIKIILADHHPKIRQGLALLLAAEAEIQLVGVAENCSTAIRLIQELSPQVVVMDIVLPDANGVDATRQIVKEFPAVKVIALSMHSDSLFALNLLKAGASGYLLKDCAQEELMRAIRTVVTGRVFLSPSLSHMLVKDLAHKITLDGENQ
jgi:two-component system, NarL family, response regulator NreC